MWPGPVLGQEYRGMAHGAHAELPREAVPVRLWGGRRPRVTQRRRLDLPPTNRRRGTSLTTTTAPISSTCWAVDRLSLSAGETIFSSCAYGYNPRSRATRTMTLSETRTLVYDAWSWCLGHPVPARRGHGALGEPRDGQSRTRGGASGHRRPGLAVDRGRLERRQHDYGECSSKVERLQRLFLKALSQYEDATMLEKTVRKKYVSYTY